MKKIILNLFVSIFVAQSAIASCEDFSSTQPKKLSVSSALTCVPQDLSYLPVGPLDLEADMLILNEFTQKGMARDTNPVTQRFLQKMGQEIDTHSLILQIKPFLSKTPPKKSIETIKKFDLMQTSITDFFIHFHCLFNLVLSDESERLFGYIDIDTNHHVHLLFQETTRAFLRLSNAYCALLESKDPVLFQNFHGAIPSKGKRRALGYLKENENFLLVPLGGIQAPLFLARHNHAPNRHTLNSGILYQNQKIVQNPGVVLIYDKDLVRDGRPLPWQVSAYSGADTSFGHSPFTLSQKNLLLTEDFFTSHIQPTSFNCSINTQALRALFLEDALKASEEATNVVAGFFEFPQSQIDGDLVDLLLLEDLMQETQTPLDAEPTSEKFHPSSPLLLTYMSTFYEKEPEEILKEKEETLFEKIAGQIRNEHTITTTDSLEKKSKQTASTRTKKKTRGPAKKTGKSSDNAKASTSQAKQQKTPPSEEAILHEARARLKTLKIEGRLKWGAVLKRVNKVCSDLPTLTDNSTVSIAGSHIVVHTPKGSPITLVKPHKGRDAVYPDTARSFFMDLIMTGLQQNGS